MTTQLPLSPVRTLCSVENCVKVQFARGLCNGHWARWRKSGDPQADVPLRAWTQTPEDRFWSKVDKSGDCWLWTGCKANAWGGYGQFLWKGKVRLAHRVAWEIAFGPIPKGEGWHGTCVLHHCDNPCCVRPSHLFLGSNYDNVLDKMRKGRHPRAGCRGERNGMAKVTASQAAEIRRFYSRGGITQREIGLVYGLSPTNVGRIVRGELWAS